MAIRGVNLGNWLVLEKWMGDSPLSASSAEDDYAWIDEVPRDAREQALEQHYRTYVTEQTIAWLAGVGVSLVRVPLPYHLFGTPHHSACARHLDDVFDWAERYGLGILVDLHTVPYSVNGFDNGGYTALCAWGRNERRVTATLDLLVHVARRYAGRCALWGIEPLNEPVSWRVYAANFSKNRHHLRRIIHSRPLSRSSLVSFYQRFYDRVRPIVGPEVNLVFHDQFSLRGWERFDPGHGDDHVWLDTHQYVALADGWLPNRNLDEYLGLVEYMGARVRRAAAYHPVLVGEWSLANHAGELAGLDQDQTRDWYQAYARAQLRQWDAAGGSCFWSLRVRGSHRENWSFTTCIERDWLVF